VPESGLRERAGEGGARSMLLDREQVSEETKLVTT